ncbi:nitrate/nitrite transporter NrtS [Zhongshania sp.]|jgi:hypothetical protein|uniref:nitrate/nitrite transporter NrtS n=1 Tax=Zhongshania sp. TaxID=1971902 RepID=UPI0039E2A688
MLRFLEVALQPKVYRTALKVCLLVGTILALINHGSAIFNLSLSTQNILQIILSYLVPYSVSTYSSVKIILNSDH